MPWFPDLFSAPVLERIRGQAADARVAAPVPYFDGVRSGEIDALVGSFAGEPELHHPVRGRVRGRPAFERFVADTNAWLTERRAVFSPVERIITPGRGIEETVLTLDGENGRVEMPAAVVADRDDDGRIIELRIYWSMWPLTGEHHHRAPLLEPDPDLREPDVVGEYQRALASGDVEAAVGTFEPDAYVREPAGSAYVHRGHDELLALYRRFFSNGGGIRLEHCTLTDDGRACALEYNIVRWGRTEVSPEAGVAVYVRGASGRLASARMYDDIDPPVSL
jgi:SnoaL-like protein